MPSELILTYFFAGYLAAVLPVCTATDIRHFVIPDGANAASFAGALALALASPHHPLGPKLLGGVIGGAAFLAATFAYRYCRHTEGLGLGDAKFMLGAGTWVGWQGLAPLVFMASASALLYIAVRTKADKEFDRRARIPFAPFLSIATLSVWLLQESGGAPWIP